MYLLKNFRLERQAEEKYEYHDGEIVGRTDCAPLHCLIAANVGASLRTALRNNRCFVFSSNLRVSVPRDSFVTYPDVAVVCGKLEYSQRDRDTIANPVVLVEVLPPSILTPDRAAKGWEYLKIPTLRDYLVIDQTEVVAGHWSRLSHNKWQVEMVHDRCATIRLDVLGLELSVSDIYCGAELFAPE